MTKMYIQKKMSEKNEKYKCGELKPKHIHLLLRFFENQPQKLKNIAGWFQIPPNFVSKIHNSGKMLFYIRFMLIVQKNISMILVKLLQILR